MQNTFINIGEGYLVVNNACKCIEAEFKCKTE
jgi:hypothetical protein